MKKAKGFAAVLLCLCLCGCSATELEDRCFPMLAVIDEQDGQITFFYGFPALSQKDNTDLSEAEVSAEEVSADSFAACVRAYEAQLEKKLDCNHLKVLVLGERFLRDEKQYEKALDYLKETELFPRNTYVCVTADTAQLYAAEESLPTDMGSYLEQYLQNHESEQEIALTSLGTLLDEQENHILTLALPYLSLEGDAIVWTAVTEKE